MKYVERVGYFVLAALVALLSVLPAGGGALQAAPPAPGGGSSESGWIQIKGTQPFVMPADQDTAVLPLVVSIGRDIETGRVTLRLLRVSFERLVDGRVTTAFSMGTELMQSGDRGPTIHLRVELKLELRPGTYELTIEAKHPDRTPQRLTAIIERPAVVFEQPSKLTIEQIYPLAGRSPRHYPEHLQVPQAPESRFARASRIEFYSRGFTQPSGGPSPGRLDFHAPNGVKPGEPLIAALVPRDFPIGTSIGSVEIRGPELKAPRTVEIEVRARRSADWIWLLVAAGLLAVYFLRTYLQGRVELGQAKLEAQKVLGRLEEAFERRRDAGFRRRVQAEMEALHGALARSGRDGIVAAARRAQENLSKASEELEARFTQAESDLRELAAALNRGYLAAPRIAAVVRDGRRLVEEGRGELKAYDVEKAEEAVGKIAAGLPTQLSHAIRLWQEDVQRTAGQLTGLRPALSQESATELEQRAAALDEQAQAVGYPKDMAAAAALAAVHEVQARMAALLGRIALLLEKDLKLFLEELRTRGLAGGERSQADAEGAAGALSAELKAAADNPDPAQPVYTPAAFGALEKSLQRMVAEALAALGENLKPDRRQAAEQSVARRSYFEAVKMLPSPTTALGREPKAPPAAGQGSWEPEVPPPADGRAVPQLIPALAPEEPLSVLRARTLKELAAAQFWQMAIAGLGIAVVGYLLFAERFMGTPAEMAAIFFWGFGLDVSVDKLLQLAGGVSGASGKK